MRVIVIIPAYNEARMVAEVVRRVRDHIPDVIVVDDGSMDATGDRAEAAGATVVRHCVNRGLGAALGTGIAAALHAGADAIVTLDADGQHDPAEIAAIVAPIAQDTADVVIGVRTFTDAPFHRRLFNQIGNLVTRLLFGVRCSDTQSGFRAFSRAAAERIDIRTNRMEVSSEIIAEAGRHELRVAEVPIRTIYTDYSLAKGQSFSVGIRTAWSLLLRRWF
jgi:glycosyltransferase involved in cell wall biosynthesis